MTARLDDQWHDRMQRFASDATRRLRDHVETQCSTPSVIHAGFCAHKNPGDNAISIAETRVLRSAGKKATRRYSDVSMMASPEPITAEIRSQPGQPAIVLSGGGFLTPLYPEILVACTRLIEEFTDRPILIMPQSSDLGQQPISRAFTAAVREHPRIRLLARDQPTFDELVDLTSADVHLVPDSVLTFGSLRTRLRPKKLPIAVVARQDGEEASDRGHIPAHPALPWMNEPRAFQDPRLLPARLQDRGVFTRHGHQFAMWVAARGRTSRGLSMVRSAELILADRLHAVILSLVAGTPVVALDNSYGKIQASIDTWDLKTLGPLETADTFGEAEEVGLTLLAHAQHAREQS